ncbi:MAG: hypothetical protein V1750_00440, partial [Acidobacteriota bacterium]
PLAVYAMEETSSEALVSLPQEPPAAVLLTSPRAAAAYLRACGRRYAAAPHFAMGGTTEAAARELGINAPALAAPRVEYLLEEKCLS